MAHLFFLRLAKYAFVFTVVCLAVKALILGLAAAGVPLP
jgi:hypothetical protein